MTAPIYRTYSSPNLKSRQQETQFDRFLYDDGLDEAIFYVIGDRVKVDGYRWASVAYFGETDFGSGDWVGVVLDEPTGNHDGRVHGRQYFQCKPMHGLFVRPHRVGRPYGTSQCSSRITSPVEGTRDRWFKSPSSSGMGSYFYDEDYRTSTPALDKRIRFLSNPVSGVQYNGYSISGTTPRPSSRMSREGKPIGILKNRGRRPQSTGPVLDRADDDRDKRSLKTEFYAPPNEQRLGYRESHTRQQKTDSITPKVERDRSSEIDYSLMPGERVIISSERGEQVATLRFLGETNFAYGLWAGVELDRPEGKNDGSILGHRYFYCPRNYGLFVPAIKVRRLGHNWPRESKLNFESMRSTIRSPPPPRPPSRESSNFSSTNGRSSVQDSSCQTSPTNDLDTTNKKRLIGLSNSSLLELDQSNGRESDRSTGSRRDIQVAPEDSQYDNLSKYRLQNDHLSTRSNAPKDKTTHSEHRGYTERVESPEVRMPYFSDQDLEYQLKRRINRPKVHSERVKSFNIEPAKAKSVQFTFTTSKLDDNPIALRKVEFD